MKIPVLALLTILVLIQTCEPRDESWFTRKLFDAVTNKTSQLTNYVRLKGRSLRQFYVDSVKNKITSYLGQNANKSDSEVVRREDRHAMYSNRFKDYIESSESEKTKIFDSIAPEKLKNKCSDADPSVLMTTPQLIALHGYPAQSHTVVTSDGYILTIHRIPYSSSSTTKTAPRKTVLLHHGLLGSSSDWVIPGPSKALAYILSDAGYDVWLANARGNTYSRAHVSRNIDSFEFWNFTFHEIAQRDLPAVIDYIMELKGWDVKINYVGHSMGTTVLFALLSTQTHYNKVLRAGFALAPVAYMTEIKSPIRLLAKFADNIEYLLKLLGQNEFLPQNAVMRWLSKHACEINHYEEVLCENSLFVLCGYDEKQFNKTLLPMILGHTPAGASTKTLVHYAQEIKGDGRFQQFDYGSEINFRTYGEFSPPEYRVAEITLPIALLSAENDWLSSDVDVTNLFVQLANPIEHYIVPLKEFNHIDFIFGIDAPSLVYKKLLQLMEEGASKSTEYTKFDETNTIEHRYNQIGSYT